MCMSVCVCTSVWVCGMCMYVCVCVMKSTLFMQVCECARAGGGRAGGWTWKEQETGRLVMKLNTAIIFYLNLLRVDEVASAVNSLNRVVKANNVNLNDVIRFCSRFKLLSP